MGKAVGIDLGTTNSVVAFKGSDNEITVIANSLGYRTTPSIVAFKEDGERLVGHLAKRQAVLNPENTIFSIKRIMGKTYDEAKEMQNLVRYKIVKGINDLACVSAADRTYTPQEISAMILGYLKKAAEDYLGEPVTKAVITVPAYFNDAQRNATLEAGKIAGLEVLRIINEPTAAALAYGYANKTAKNQSDDQTIYVAVFDLGGGTFDVSILEIGGGVFEVKATSGDNFLGGDDFDKRIVNYLVKSIEKSAGVDLSKDLKAMQRIQEAAEQAKIELSSVQSTEINLPYLCVGKDGQPVSYSCTLTRAKFEELCSDLFQRLEGPCFEALQAAGILPDQIHDVLLVGGSTRIPKVQEIASRIFGKTPSKSVNPDEAVAMGAAVQAAILTGEETGMLLLDVTPFNLGVALKDDLMAVIIPANTAIPTKRSELFTTVVPNQDKVEVVVYQGNRPIASANKLLGRFMLEGIPPAPAGIPQIEVTFDMDANGVLHVSAVDKATGKKNSITVSGSSNLPPEELERMKAEAEQYKEEDERRVRDINNQSQCERLIEQLESAMQSASEKLTEEDKNKGQQLIEQAREIRDKKDWSRLQNLSGEVYNFLLHINNLSNGATSDNAAENHSRDDGEGANPVTVEYEDVSS